jgi:hypothetical protein
MASINIGSAVGRQPALNSIADQQKIIGLLHRVLPQDGGPGTILPNPSRAGTASPELVAAILHFQRKNIDKQFQDGRVDPNRRTLRKLNELARNFFPGDPLVFPPDLEFPPAPSPSPDPAPPPTPAILRALGLSLTIWSFSGSASLSMSVGPTGAALARFFILKDGDSEPRLFDFAGLTVGKGPFPVGINVAPSIAPSLGTRIAARRAIVKHDDFKGECSIISLSSNVFSPAGVSAALVLFGARVSNPAGIPAGMQKAGAVGIIAGTFVGLDVGGSLAVGAVV